MTHRALPPTSWRRLRPAAALLAFAGAAAAAAGAAVSFGSASASSSESVLIGDGDAAGHTELGQAGVAQAFRVRAASSGRLTSLAVYVGAPTQARSLAAGVYADDGGHPGRLLAQGTAVAGKGDWSTVALGDGPALTAGSPYWVAVLAPSGDRRLALRAAGGGASETSAQTALAALPATWATGGSSADGVLAAYGVGLAADAGGAAAPTEAATTTTTTTTAAVAAPAATTTTTTPTPTPTPTPAPATTTTAAAATTTTTPAPAPTTTTTAEAPAPPPPDPAADSSGEAMPVGDLPGWRQIFADDFGHESVPLGASCGDPNGFPHPLSNWDAYPYPWQGTPTWGTYCPERTTSIHDGLMDVWLHSEPVDGRMLHLIDAPFPRIAGYPHGNGQVYGRYAIRYRVPEPFPLFHLSFMLWPDSNIWPAEGEIDFPESETDGSAWAFMHWKGGTSAGQQDAYSAGTLAGGWHTAVIEWLPSRVTFLLDGRVVGSSTDASRIPSTPMHFLLQHGGSFFVPEPDATTQGHVLVDWVAIYARS